MKMESTPKIFSAAVILILYILFQDGFLVGRSASVIGGMIREKLGVHLGMGRELPQTSLQPVEAGVLIESTYLPVIDSALVSPAFDPTVTPIPTEIPQSIAVFDTPEFYDLVAQVADGAAGMERGIFIPGKLANAIVQQPASNWAFVSDAQDVVTEFQSAHNSGVTGLLAHNYLLGGKFYEIEIGEYLAVIYGDGAVKRYQVTGIYQFQKLNQASLTSDFIDLQTGKRLTSTYIFTRFYAGAEKVTLQTCLEQNGQPSWGLTFVVAEPIQ